MAIYRVRFRTSIDLTVEIDADDEDAAADNAWESAQEYLEACHGNGRDVTAEATLDGIGADEVREISAVQR